MSKEHLANILKVVEETTHADQPKGDKIKSLVECGATAIDSLLKMKNGPLTKIKLALDHHPESEVIGTFRLLTPQEEYEILDKMSESKLSYLDIRYKIKHAALTLSKASQAVPSQKFDTPSYSETDLMCSGTVDSLIVLGLKYQEFKDKYSPKLESLTQEQIDKAIKMIEESEDDIKKSDLLNGWSLRATQEVLIDSVKKLTSVTKQMEALLIGS